MVVLVSERSGDGFVLASLKRNIDAVVSWMWGTIYNQNMNKEKQLTLHSKTLSSLKWKHKLEKEV